MVWVQVWVGVWGVWVRRRGGHARAEKAGQPAQVQGLFTRRLAPWQTAHPASAHAPTRTSSPRRLPSESPRHNARATQPQSAQLVQQVATAEDPIILRRLPRHMLPSPQQAVHTHTQQTLGSLCRGQGLASVPPWLLFDAPTEPEQPWQPPGPSAPSTRCDGPLGAPPARHRHVSASNTHTSGDTEAGQRLSRSRRGKQPSTREVPCHMQEQCHAPPPA